jgi:nucleoid DNA-binding protein
MSTQGKVNKNALYEEVADKLDMTPQEVREAVRYQFKYLRDIMAEGDFEPVRLRYFGLFHVKEERLKHLNKS